MIIDFKCTIEKKVSKESKKVYYVLTINELGKQVFLTDTEVKLLNALHLLNEKKDN